MIFSSLAYVFFLHKNLVIIGASGAAMGLISAAMLLDPFCITWEMILPIPMMIKGWLFIYADFRGFLNGETDGVSHLTHLFGYVSIAALVYFLSKKDRKKMRVGLIINIVSLALVLLLRNYLINHTAQDNINSKNIKQGKVFSPKIIKK
jgi:membrane associated rhomboid family serine protease